MEDARKIKEEARTDALDHVYKKLCEIVGLENVSNKKYVRLCYSRDSSSLPGKLPDIVVQPCSTEEIQEILKLANDTKTPVYARGSGSGLWGGTIPYKAGIVLNCAARFNRFIKLDKKTLTCLVEPGIDFGTLEAVLIKDGFREHVAPEGGLSGTVGGHWITHGLGIGSAIYGNQGDAVIGIEVVLPNGEVVRTGSQMNPNAHGDFFRYSYCNDLTGLFCGSEGTLGVVTKLAIKVEKVPEDRGYTTFGFPDLELAGNALLKMRTEGLNMIFATLRPRKGLQLVSGKPWPHEGTLMIIIEGPSWRVSKEIEIASSICSEEKGVYLGPDMAKSYWMDRFRHGPAGMYKVGSRHILPVIIPLGELGYYYKKIQEIMEDVCYKYGFVREYPLLGRVASYVIGAYGADRAWVAFPNILYQEWNPDEWPEKLHIASSEVKTRFIECGIVPYRLGTMWPNAFRNTGAPYQLVKTIKNAVDPNGIMNPGIIDL
jgi:FAD/FMN-containing dehydrogenase